MSKKQERVTCEECGLEGARGNMYKLELYDTPWEDKPRIAYVHKKLPARLKRDDYLKYMESCEELVEDTGWADFRYFTCQVCYRQVCRQNPANGWHSQVRVVGDEELCLKCYEEHILDNGVEREEFEEGHLPGMFFSGDNHEPLDAGYECIMDNVFIGDPKPVIAKALELIDRGHKVVIGYESMGIGGSEGAVSLFAKSIKEV